MVVVHKASDRNFRKDPVFLHKNSSSIKSLDMVRQ